MSLGAWLRKLAPAIAVGFSCGSAERLPLCRILPDAAALGSYCALDLSSATFSDVARTFHLSTALDSTHQSLVVLQTAAVQLSFGGEFSAEENTAARVRADAPVRSVMMRRYFATAREAAEFLAKLRQRIEASYSCAKDTPATDWPEMTCRDATGGATAIRYLWTNWADDPSAKAPFEITITARLL